MNMLTLTPAGLQLLNNRMADVGKVDALPFDSIQIETRKEQSATVLYVRYLYEGEVLAEHSGVEVVDRTVMTMNGHVGNIPVTAG